MMITRSFKFMPRGNDPRLRQLSAENVAKMIHHGDNLINEAQDRDDIAFPKQPAAKNTIINIRWSRKKVERKTKVMLSIWHKVVL